MELSINGGKGADTIRGGGGADTLNGGAGNDSMTGGDGSDSYFVNVGDLVFENAGQGSDTLIGNITAVLRAKGYYGVNVAKVLEIIRSTRAATRSAVPNRDRCS